MPSPLTNMLKKGHTFREICSSKRKPATRKLEKVLKNESFKKLVELKKKKNQKTKKKPA